MFFSPFAFARDVEREICQTTRSTSQFIKNRFVVISYRLHRFMSRENGRFEMHRRFTHKHHILQNEGEFIETSSK